VNVTEFGESGEIGNGEQRVAGEFGEDSAGVEPRFESLLQLVQFRAVSRRQEPAVGRSAELQDLERIDVGETELDAVEAWRQVFQSPMHRRKTTHATRRQPGELGWNLGQVRDRLLDPNCGCGVVVGRQPGKMVFGLS
jgi:hypothetical protein